MPARPLNRRKWIFPILALALGLLLAEGLCRLVFESPFAGRAIATGMLYDPRWGVIHEPGASYRSQDPANRTDFEMRINSHGFRSPELAEKREDRWRVVFVGDSFTEGYGVEVEDGLVALSERRFREHGSGIEVEFVNAGIRGGAPTTYRLQLERTLALEPDAVVLVAYDNDLADDFYYSFDQDHLRARVYATIQLVPFESRLLELLGEALVRVERQLAVARAEDIVGGEDLRAPTYEFGTGNVAEDPLGFYADPAGWEVHWEWTRSLLDAIADDLSAHGVALVIAYIPGPQSGIHRDCCVGVYPAAPGRRPGEVSVFGDWLRAFAAERALPFVDVHAALLELDAAGDPEPVYEIANGHLNARGNGIVADLVFEALRRLTPR